MSFPRIKLMIIPHFVLVIIITIIITLYDI
nr:MAG TPA: hypothetical protein [Caudoviricetes sp.]